MRWDPMPKWADTLTILRAMGGLRLTKAWKVDGTIAGYDDAKHHTRKAVRVTDCRSLSALLTKLEREPQRCVIWGRYGDGQADGGAQTTYARSSKVTSTVFHLLAMNDR
jgi:hypothetical protein